MSATNPRHTRWGLDQNVAAALAYALGFPGGIVFLLVEKHNRYVRFHAMQSVITFSMVAALFLMLSGLGWMGRALAVPLLLGVIALWIYLMVQAIKGRTYRLPIAGAIAEGQLR